MIARSLKTFLPLSVLLLGLPLLGVRLAGKQVSQFLEFPPTTRYVEHAPFSPAVFAAMAVVFVSGAVLFLVAVVRRVSNTPASPAPDRRDFPWWGWTGLAFGVLAWVAAWTRLPALRAVQAHAFTPLWLAYILVVNALAHWRTGQCMMTRRPGRFLALFPASAAFWWFFEYLNRFAQNWHYVGVREFTPTEYFLYATLPFSTVLPAVLGTRDFLKSLPRLSRAATDLAPLRFGNLKPAAWVILFCSSASLAAVGVWPNLLFPCLWLSPLLVLTSLQGIQGQPAILAGLKTGDWRNAFLLALSALVCGFFWEMWNCGSMAQWRYSIPFVDGFHLFEMPILGYAGYIPFGLECGAVEQLLDDAQDRVSLSRPRRRRDPEPPCGCSGAPVERASDSPSCRRLDRLLLSKET